jgi:hypothetical protein
VPSSGTTSTEVERLQDEQDCNTGSTREGREKDEKGRNIKSRVQLDLTPRAMALLTELTEKTDAATCAEVFKNAMKLYDGIISEIDRGLEFLIRAEIMQKRLIDNQTFYLVKLVFPRGDAASSLFGFDIEGKITGIGVESMAGD